MRAPFLVAALARDVSGTIARRAGAAVAALLLAACGGSDGPGGPPPAPPVIPALEEIAYDRLWAGTLAFERLGPTADTYQGVYVIDASARTSATAVENTVLFGPVLSPDGRQLAYTRYSNSESVFDVHVADVDGANVRRVTSFPGQDGDPSWMPDGRLIAVADAGGFAVEVYRQSPVTAPADRELLATFRPVADHFVCPYIVHDDSGDPGPISAAADGRLVFACLAHEITVIGASGRDTTTLYRTPAAAPGQARVAHAPAWSPDGTRVAFTEHVYELDQPRMHVVRTSLLVIDAAGGSATTLATVAGGVQTPYGGRGAYSVCWAPDGARLAFTAPDGDERAHVYVVGADGAGLVQVTTAPGVTDRSVSCSR